MLHESVRIEGDVGWAIQLIRCAAWDPSDSGYGGTRSGTLVRNEEWVITGCLKSIKNYTHQDHSVEYDDFLGQQ